MKITINDCFAIFFKEKYFCMGGNDPFNGCKCCDRNEEKCYSFTDYHALDVNEDFLKHNEEISTCYIDNQNMTTTTCTINNPMKETFRFVDFNTTDVWREHLLENFGQTLFGRVMDFRITTLLVIIAGILLLINALYNIIDACKCNSRDYKYQLLKNDDDSDSDSDDDLVKIV